MWSYRKNTLDILKMRIKIKIRANSLLLFLIFNFILEIRIIEILI